MNVKCHCEESCTSGSDMLSDRKFRTTDYALSILVFLSFEFLGITKKLIEYQSDTLINEQQSQREVLASLCEVNHFYF